MAGKSPIVVNSNIRIQGATIDKKKALDYRYGPWSELSIAYENLYYPDFDEDTVYYGLTIGINVYNDDSPRKVIGVDEYWWQPNCVPNPDYDPEDPESQQYIDGFIRKYPANTPATVDKEDSDKVLGISSEPSLYGAVWADDERGSDWHDIDPETLEDVGTEDP